MELISNILLTICIFAKLVNSNTFTAMVDNSKYIEYRNSSADRHCPAMKAWSALKPKSIKYSILPWKNVIIYHTMGIRCYTDETCSAIVQNIQNYSMGDGKCLDIKFNFLIGEDGNIYRGTDWFRLGCHTENYNENATSIAFIGDFKDHLPNDRALQNAKNLITCGLKKEYIDSNYKLFGANQLNLLTKSPGAKLYNEIKTWDKWSETI